MGIAKLYAPNEIPEKIMNLLSTTGVIRKEDNIVCLLGSTVLWGLGPCIALTDKDVIYFDNTKGLLPKTQRYSLKGIGSIQLKQKGISREIVLGLSGAGEESINIPAEISSLEKFYDKLLEYHAGQKSVNSQQPQATSADIPEQIKKLADLRDQGILTEEEFQDKKTTLLSKM